ncbi:hypothetical protein TSTA_086520 [Talaromyces stipitatus ATCC 10500]|uniref:Uncharacterized protein n=1 Tax=Talaromyces stipitatus (strain ATCC 10500 / CBS 375.48 / QM 6759 / NRRL 1006) TaxID=441959 RepID=B8M0N6_TALSN|nr:uncharacterized protein TSTA_086520 [Talaromyces stipitatus ATCC 10500]EED21419.1 hypothetical protein TSTA_086520 [Talaromyces stipitatus ATCC 10500]
MLSCGLFSKSEETSKVASIKKVESDDEDEKHIIPDFGTLDLTNGQYRRYGGLTKSLAATVSLFPSKRRHMVVWLWEKQYLCPFNYHALAEVKRDRFETFLVAAEKIMALRKEKKSTKHIIDIAGEYVATHRMVWSEHSGWREALVRYFVGHVLWCFFEAYPKFVPIHTSNKDPLEHAVTSMLGLPDSDIDQLITSIGVIVPNARDGGIDDLFGSWTDGRLIYLSRRVLNFGMHNKRTSDKLLKAGKENGSTINLRLALARHLDQYDRREMMANAIEMSRALYGEFHAITWHCTEQLGKFWLDMAPDNMIRYYFSNTKGNKEQVVLDLYEKFLNHAEKIELSSSLKTSEREALSDLLKHRVVPAVANTYMKNGKELEARKLLWRSIKDSSSQIYQDNWRPFGPRLGSMDHRLLLPIQSLGEFDGCYDLAYSSLELVIFPFDEISLQLVKPSDEEKSRKWHFVFEWLPNGDVHNFKSIEWSPGLEGGYEPRVVQEVENSDRKESMILELPYIAYGHFKTSQEYRKGRTYEYYRKGSNNQQLDEWMRKDENKYTLRPLHGGYVDYLALWETWPSVGGALVNSEKGEIEKFLYDRETGSLKFVDEKEKLSPHEELDNPPRYKVLDISECKEHIPGFFNSTPGDVAAVDETSAVSQGFNLVSAEWYDWKRFILHPCDSSMEQQPELVATDGTPIPILGYIYGSWTDDKLRKQWRGLQIWVTQATFSPDTSQDGQSCHFVLNPQDFLTPSETREICKFLNPSMLRVMNHETPILWACTMGEPPPDDFEGVTIKPPPGTQRDIIAETCFRDAWDTDFAFKFWNRLLMGNSRRKIMSDQLKEETSRRREWDRECSGALKPWLHSRK